MKIMQKIWKGVCLSLLLSLLLIAGTVGLADFFIPDTLSIFDDETPSIGGWGTLTVEESVPCGTHATSTRATARLFGILPIKKVEVKSFEHLSLCPGGDVFGIRVSLGGAMVTSFTRISTDGNERSPAEEAGLLCGDLITAVDGVRINEATELSRAISASEGRRLTLSVLRNGRSLTLSLLPAFSDAAGAYRAGILVKDSASGIGTVTFIDPETGAFGGLGHGIYDGESGVLIPIQRGAVTDVTLSGVIPGVSGDPGELRGHLGNEKRGTLLSNTDCGVFGVMSSTDGLGEPIPIGLSSSVHVGKAEVLCTLEDGVCRRYAIEITGIRDERSATKSFTVRVTDPHLLEATGGIVQGMSGSPIIQDGHLIGAVTHVMVNDPTAGYGIFIENMLSAAEGVIPKAA